MYYTLAVILPYEVMLPRLDSEPDYLEEAVAAVLAMHGEDPEGWDDDADPDYGNAFDYCGTYAKLNADKPEGWANLVRARFGLPEDLNHRQSMRVGELCPEQFDELVVAFATPDGEWYENIPFDDGAFRDFLGRLMHRFGALSFVLVDCHR